MLDRRQTAALQAAPGVRIRVALLVLGMHRSGTSALAGALSLLGATPPRTMLPSNDFNERGYWESAPLVQLNDRFLHSIGSAWDDIRDISLDSVSETVVDSYRDSAHRALVAEYGEAPTIIVKDPRASRIAPLILEALKSASFAPLSFVIFRNPLEVALSLKRRDGFTLQHSLLLWLRHNLDAELHTRGAARSVLSYEELLKDSQRVLARSLRSIPSERPPQWTDEQAERVSQFLATELRHERQEAADLSSDDVNNWVRTTYESLETLAHNDGDLAALAALDNVRFQFNEAVALFAPIISHVQRQLNEERTKAGNLASQLVKSSHDAMAVREASVAEVQSVVEEYNKLAARLTQSSLDAEQMRRHFEAEANLFRAALTQSNLDAEQMRKHFETEANAFRTALETSNKQARDAQARSASLAQSLAACDAELAAARAQGARLEQDLASRQCELQALTREVGERSVHNTQLDEQIAALHRSSSWKVTRPLRFAGRLLRFFR